MDSRSSGKYLGMVVGGSLSRGVDVRLDTQAQVEEMALGQHVVIHGKSRRFFGVITDIALESSDESLRGSPPDLSNPIVAQVVADTATYATLRVLPMLALEGALAAVAGPTPAKTVPPHFAPVHLASEEDVQMVFGAEDNRHFWVGNPLDMETRVCLDLEEFVKRSNGVFGKSGTGKSFLTRLLLVGILQKSAAVNLVFDMESEYGWMGTSEGAGMVKGIKQLFPSQVSVFSLDDEHSRRRGVSPDYLIRVGYNQITPEDIELLRRPSAYRRWPRTQPTTWRANSGRSDGWGSSWSLAARTCESWQTTSTSTREPFPHFTTGWAGSNASTSSPRGSRRSRWRRYCATWTGAYTWWWSSGGTGTSFRPTCWWPT